MMRGTSSRSFVSRWAGAVVLLAACTGASAINWDVYDVTQLNTAVTFCNAWDTITVHPGTYNLTTNLWMDTRGVTLQGATSSRDDVVLWGGGMNNSSGVYEGVQIINDDITIKDLTIEGFYNHAIHFQPGADRSHVDNVRTLNIGQQHMKGGNSALNAINDGIIENSLMEQTIPRTNHPDPNYLGGVDLLGATNWIIRDNVARNIQGETGEGGGAIFLWQKIVNPTVERNVIVGCDRGIAMGNPGYQQADNLVGGIVRNNFVSHANEINLELIATTDLKVYNNTLYGLSGSSYTRCVSMEGAITSGLELVNNLIYGNIADRGLPFTNTNNIVGTTAGPSWFVDMPNGDLHLTELALGAIDAAVPLAQVPDDVDGGPRPHGAAPDIGADEFASPMGDANRDGNVDLLDLTIVANYWQQTGNWGNGDFNQTGNVDLLDLTLLANNWGFPGGAAAVPEPVAAVLLGLGGLALVRRRRP